MQNELNEMCTASKDKEIYCVRTLKKTPKDDGTIPFSKTYFSISVTLINYNIFSTKKYCLHENLIESNHMIILTAHKL
jgi:hypothetical protein